MATVPSNFVYNGHFYIIGQPNVRPGTASIYRPSTAAIAYRCMITLQEQFIVVSERLPMWNDGPVGERDLTGILTVVRIETIFSQDHLDGWRRIYG